MTDQTPLPDGERIPLVTLTREDLNLHVTDLSKVRNSPLTRDAPIKFNDLSKLLHLSFGRYTVKDRVGHVKGYKELIPRLDENEHQYHVFVLGSDPSSIDANVFEYDPEINALMQRPDIDRNQRQGLADKLGYKPLVRSPISLLVCGDRVPARISAGARTDLESELAIGQYLNASFMELGQRIQILYLAAAELDIAVSSRTLLRQDHKYRVQKVFQLKPELEPMILCSLGYSQFGNMAVK
jgi:hypothetical protein